MKKFFDNWIFNPTRRYSLFTGISFGFAFLIPVFGWNPLLLLWIVNGCLCCKEAESNPLKVLHAILVIVFGLLFAFNLCLNLYALMQYLGYFT